MSVPQRGVCGRLPASPRSRRAGAGPLVPNDLAPHQKPSVKHLADDVAVKRDIRLSAKVGHVDACPAARHKHAVAFSKNSPE